MGSARARRARCGLQRIQPALDRLLVGRDLVEPRLELGDAVLQRARLAPGGLLRRLLNLRDLRLDRRDVVLRRRVALELEREYYRHRARREAQHRDGAEHIRADADAAVELRQPGAKALDRALRFRNQRRRLRADARAGFVTHSSSGLVRRDRGHGADYLGAGLWGSNFAVRRIQLV